MLSIFNLSPGESTKTKIINLINNKIVVFKTLRSRDGWFIMPNHGYNENIKSPNIIKYNEMGANGYALILFDYCFVMMYGDISTFI